jgi:F-type H+-transporting ATPase subunit epsilon
MMRLKVVQPTGVVLEQEAAKIVAEAPNGSFCLLPRHIDFVTALVPGILALTDPEGEEIFLAVDEGLLVKRGVEVVVSTWSAIPGPLGELRQAISRQHRELDEREQKAREALTRLEASLVRQILE